MPTFELLTSEDYQVMVAEAFNRAGDDAFAVRVRKWWVSHARQAAISDRAQYLYTLREAVRWAQGQGWETNYDMQSGATSLSRRGRAVNLREMLDGVNREIQEEIVLARSSRTPRSGTITKVTPLPQRVGRPDPNDRAYRGDPVVTIPSGLTDTVDPLTEAGHGTPEAG